MSDEKVVNILLVEDNAGDIRLTQEALKEGKINNSLSLVRDGQEAIEFLEGKGKYKNNNRPDLILLDLNLPKVDGRKVLKFIKTNPSLKVIPVVILTTSENEADILKSYDLHANCYIKKPVDFDRFIEIVKGIDSFWLSIVRLPPNKILDENNG